MGKVIVLLLIVVPCVSALTLMIGRRDSSRSRDEMGNSGAPSEERVSEPHAPRLSPVAMNHHAEEARRSPAPVPVAKDESKQTAPERATTPEEVASAHETAFQADAPPTETSRKTAAVLVTAFTGYQAKGAHLTAVDCRATRCRMEMEFPDRATDDLVLGSLPSALSSGGIDISNLAFIAPIRDTLPNDSRKITAYLYQQ